MKVAILGPFYNAFLRPVLPGLSDDDILTSPGMGGYGLKEIVLQRVLQGHSTVLITLDWNMEKEEMIHRSNGNFSFYSLPRRKRKAIRDLYSWERKKIQEVLIEEKPDLIHSFFTNEYSLAALTRGWNVPVLVGVCDHAQEVLRHSGIRYLPQYLISLWVIRHARYITINTPTLRRFIETHSRAKIWEVYNSISRELLTDDSNPPRKLENGRPVIVSAINWTKLKNPQTLLRAFRIVRKKLPATTLHLCGVGLHSGGPADVWAKRHGLDEGVVFQGMLPHDRLIGLMKEADLLVHPSLSDTCNLAIAEALAVGIPVIGGIDSGGVPWQLDGGKAGMLVDMRNPEKLADAVLHILQDRELYAYFLQPGKRQARFLFDPEMNYARFHSIYAEITGENS